MRLIAAVIARPGIGLQRFVAPEERTASGEPVAPALGDEPDLTAAGAAVLRHVVGREHLHFLQRVDVLNADDRAGRPRANRDRAIDRNRVLVGTATIDAEAAVAES